MWSTLGGGAVAGRTEHLFDSLVHERMVLGLGQPGDRRHGDLAHTTHADRHGAAVGGVPRDGETGEHVEVGSGGGVATADQVGRLAGQLGDASLADDPCIVLGGAPGQRDVERLLPAVPDPGPGIARPWRWCTW
ncbi:MAG TPA: hypothetical protein PKB06_02845 [Actinotalea sp.]|nr:hypothetical protein [Actinotalea sp.]